jgi:AcrR family transcriptional regulator
MSEAPAGERADARRNRERILEAARAVFAEQGSEAQIDDVARRAELGVGTIYRHFPNKDVLLAELIREKFRLFAEHAREALERDAEPFAVLCDLLRRNAEHCARDAAMQHAMSGAGEDAWSYAQPEIDELNRLVGILIGRAHDAGTMRRDVGVGDIPMLMCAVSSTMTHSFTGFDWRRHLELTLEMLRAAPPCS